MPSRWDRFFSLFGRKRYPLPDLDVRIGCFREILHANNAALGFLAGIQEAMEDERPLPAAEVRRLVAGVTTQTYRMVSNLNQMTGDRYRAVLSKFHGIKARVARRVELMPTLRPVGYMVPLDEVDPSLAEVVGQKSAYLGQARRILQGHVPPGFATTLHAYRAFMEMEGLGERVCRVMAGVNSEDVAACFQASARVTQMIENAAMPPDLIRSIHDAVAALPGGPSLRLAVRSSALQEGGLEMSFAGQYRSMLNVPPGGVVDAFRAVAASKYSPQAITYRLGRGYDDAEVAMCCCVLTMVDAAAAGVIYSSFPTPEGKRTLLQAVRGLGLSAVDGSAEPDSFTLDQTACRVSHFRRGIQRTLLSADPIEGTERVPMGEENSGAPVLTPDQALQVADLAWRLESALGLAIDVEWAIDREGRIYVLQVRPLSDVADQREEPRKERIAGERVLIERGARASGGTGAGRVFHVETDLDILRCPADAVIVTREANPRFTVLLPRAAAIVADMGEVTSHLATVARELRVPALFATRIATETLGHGQMVTVDADAGVVYAGRVEAALVTTAPKSGNGTRDPHRELLRSVSDLIIPLTLRDRLASGFAPRKCQTLHDIIRFCHQATIEAMFDLGDKTLRSGQPLRRLVSPVPIDCRVFDLGGGLKPKSENQDVTMDDVACKPMIALWRGMTDPRLHWRKLRPMTVRGFMSALVNYNLDDDAKMRRLGDPSYAFISAEYLNLNSRIGYHFSTVDARICDTLESNYASFRFVGGATGIEHRSRRAMLIQRLLAARGFETDRRADLINARMRHRPAAQMEEAVYYIGLVMGYVNHLDMALASDAVIKAYEEAFLVGNYSFEWGEDRE
jgi:pyruvate,water dikinase